MFRVVCLGLEFTVFWPQQEEAVSATNNNQKYMETTV